MKFHEREYSVYVFFVGNSGKKPWLSSTWQKISDATRLTFSFARDHGAVRSTQYGIMSSQIDQVKFGRITHNARGAAKWTHEPDGQLASGEPAFFGDAEVWAPSWNACVRDGKAPDVYLQIFNRLGLTPNRNVDPPAFESLCIFAIANDLGDNAHTAGFVAAEALSILLASPLSVVRRQPWGHTSGSGFTDAINDLAMTEPFRPPMRKADEPSASLLKSGWTLFPYVGD